MMNLKKSAIACSLLIIFTAFLYMTPAVHAQDSTTTTVDCIPPAPSPGEPVDCTATVTNVSSTQNFPTGTVTFQIPGSGVGMPTCTLTPTSGSMGRISSCFINFSIVAPGTYEVTASYEGDQSHMPSTSAPFILVVGMRIFQASTTTILGANLAIVAVNQGDTLVAAVTDTSPTPTTPTGTVDFFSIVSGCGPHETICAPPGTLGGSFNPNPCTLAPTTNPAQSQCSTSYTPGRMTEGFQTLTASYSGDLTHQTSQGSNQIEVTQRTTSTSVSCPVATLTDHHSTPCTAVVTDTSPGTPITPSGTVAWRSSGKGAFSPNPCTLSGAGQTATCAVTYTASPGKPLPQTITGTYSGDFDHYRSSGTTPITTP